VYNESMGLIYILVAYVMAITLHEFMHAFVSHQLGDTTAQRHGRLSLNPLAHVDPVLTLIVPAVLILIHSPVIFGAARPVPFNPWAVRWGKWGVVLVAICGPFTNLFLAVFFAIWLRFVPVNAITVEFFITVIKVNVGFFVFNMIPFPPLDGSRLLYAVAPTGLRNVMDKLERAGMAAIFLLLFVAAPILSPFLVWAIGGILQILIPGLTSLSA
jgi:Zn-dependent protease